MLLLASTNAAQSQKFGTGFELSLAFKETIAAQRADIEDFIFKAKYTQADKEERLRLIEERQSSFSLALNEIAVEREELKMALANNTITQDAFTVGMRALGLKIACNSRLMQSIEKALAELGREFVEKQKFRVLEERHRELKNRFTSEWQIKVNETALPQEGYETPTQKIERINENRRRVEK